MKLQPRFGMRRVDSVREIPEELWTKCFPPQLEGRWWYDALERAGLESQFEFLYVVIEEGGRPVGIAPCFLMNLPLDLVAPRLIARLLPFVPRLRHQRTLFVGSPCADEGTVGLAPGLTLAQVAPGLQDALEDLAQQREASMIVWKDFPEETRAELEPLVREHGMFRVVSYPNTRLRLEGCRSFGEYLGRLSKNNRWGLRKKLKRSHAQGELEVVVKQHPTVRELDEIFGLFWQTYLHGKVKFEQLTPAFFGNVAATEEAWFIMLRDPGTGRLAGFKLCFRCGNRLINKYIGIDYEYGGDWYLLFRLWEATIGWAIQQGALELQSGQTGYGPKFDMGFTAVPLTNTCKHLNRFINRILALVARNITWATLDGELGKHLKAHGACAAPADAEQGVRNRAA